MAKNKVIFNGETLIDLTDDTVDATKIISGYTAHDRHGELIVGVSKGELVEIKTIEELQRAYDHEFGFLISFDEATAGITYVTNSLKTAGGVFLETDDVNLASAWFFEKIDGYSNRYSIYTMVSGQKMYMFNNTSAGANFMGLSETSKAMFDVTEENTAKFSFKISTGNKWFQHSKSGGGMRLYTDKNNTNNSQMFLTYMDNAIVPSGTLTITENGSYDIRNYKTVIVNVS